MPPVKEPDPWWANLATIILIIIVALPVGSALAWVTVWFWVDILHKTGH